MTQRDLLSSVVDVSNNPVAVIRNTSTDSRIDRVSAFEAPRSYTDDDVAEMGEGTAGVSLASVLSTMVQDTGAHHAIVDFRPVRVLSLQDSVTLSTHLLIDNVDVNVHQLLGRMTLVLEMTPSNMTDRGTINEVVVRTRDARELDSAGEHGGVVEADDCDVVVQDGVNVLRMHDNPADGMDSAAAVSHRAAENYTPKWNSVPIETVCSGEHRSGGDQRSATFLIPPGAAPIGTLHVGHVRIGLDVGSGASDNAVWTPRERKSGPQKC